MSYAYEDDRDLDHPCWSNPANHPYNGFSWSSIEGTSIDEPVSRMSMITQYATFEPSREFRRICDAAVASVLPEDSQREGVDYYGYLHGQEAQRDFFLMCMGL